MSWQTVALELLRRRTGGRPVLADAGLAAEGAEHQRRLVEKRLDGVYYLECGLDHPRRRLYQALWNAQQREATTVLETLALAGVQPIAFKGIEIGARYDHGQGTGLREDVDLLVTPDAVWEVKRALHGLGYVHGVYRPETRAWVELDYVKAARHEAEALDLVPFSRAITLEGADPGMLAEARRYPSLFSVHDDCALVFVSFHVHHNILFRFDVAPFFERSVASALGVGRALAPADHLWYAIQRYYYDVAMGAVAAPRVLALIAPMVADGAMDWDLVTRTAAAQRTAAPCFHWLTFFQRLGAAVPEGVLGELRSRLGESERRWGWQLGRLFDVDEEFPSVLLGAG